MGDVTCQMGLGAACELGRLPRKAAGLAPADQLVLVLLQKVGQALGTTAGDAALRDHASLAAMLAAGTGNLECTTPSYTRVYITSGTTVTYDAVNKRRDFGWPAQTILGLGAATGTGALQQVQKLIVCYQPVIGSGGDAAIQPLVAHDYFHVCDGNDFQLTQPNGSYRDVG